MDKLRRTIMKLLQRLLYKESEPLYKEVSIRREDAYWLFISTNILLLLYVNNEPCFFRKCFFKEGKKEYVLTSIENFFTHVNDNSKILNFKEEIPVKITFDKETVESFHQYIQQMENESLLSRLVDLDLISNKYGFNIWKGYPETCIVSIKKELGLANLDPVHYDIFLLFIWYMRNCAVSYRENSYIKDGHYSFVSININASIDIVARYLNISKLVVDSIVCKMQIEDEEYIGVLAPMAPGIRAVDVEGNIPIDPDIQRQLMNLNILDAICYQTDHGLHNYNVVLSEGMITDVCAFDNDNPMTFFTRIKLKNSLGEYSPILNEQGLINRPFMDKALVDRIQNLDKGRLKKELQQYLSALQIFYLMLRISKLQIAIEKSVKKGTLVLLDRNEWNSTTMDRELSGQFGETYFCRLYHWVNNQSGSK